MNPMIQDLKKSLTSINMLNKYDTFLKQQFKKADTTELKNYWANEYILFEQYLDDLELGVHSEFEPHKDFTSYLKCIFSTGDSIQDVLAYCYDELPILTYKEITFGSKSILECPINATVTIDYDNALIKVEDKPIYINGYNLFVLTTGVF